MFTTTATAATTEHVIIALCVIVLTALLVLSVIHARFEHILRAMHARPRTPEDISRDVKTGDVVFFVNKRPKFVVKAIGAMCNSALYHVGIAHCSPGSPAAILHFVDPRHREFYAPKYVCRSNIPGDGLCTSDLLGLLRNNTGGYVCVVPSSIAYDPEWLLAKCMDTACHKHPMRYDIGFIETFVASFFTGTPSSTTMHCNTFVGMTMESMGVFGPSRNPTTKYIPGALLPMLVKSGAYGTPRCWKITKSTSSYT